jgi:hypothetical protein
VRRFLLDWWISEEEGTWILQNIHCHVFPNNLILSNRVCWVCWLHGQRS